MIVIVCIQKSKVQDIHSICKKEKKKICRQLVFVNSAQCLVNPNHCNKFVQYNLDLPSLPILQKLLQYEN